MPSTPTSPQLRRVVVIGNGMVGHRFCECLTDRDGARQFAVTVLGEEPRPAYDRVHLTSYLGGKTAEDLCLGGRLWYEARGIDLRTSAKAARIDREDKAVYTERGERIPYDTLVLATGSAPFVPPTPGIEKKGVFVYRTIDDLDAIATYGGTVKKAAVIGGGLLGLEAAKALLDLGLETTIVEFAPRLMPRQLNQAGSDVLAAKIEALGVRVLTGYATEEVMGNGSVAGMRFAGGESLDVDLIVVSAGIRPRDELARESGVAVGPRGGVAVNERLQTSDPDIFAIGEVALYDGMVYGLVAPGYDMADALAANLVGEERTFFGADLSTKLKLMGVDVASFGDPFRDESECRVVEFRDAVSGLYKRIAFTPEGDRVIGGMLVGDTSDYARLAHYAKSDEAIPCPAEELILGTRGGDADAALTDDMPVCSCNAVTKGAICGAIREGELTTLDSVKSCTKAGTGCGGCLPLVGKLLETELKNAGKAVKPRLCAHFDYTRQELFQIVRVRGYRTFAELIRNHGDGSGCEVCKPAVASILASLWNEPITDDVHHTLQDTNDRFLANVQRNGTYSVVPRVPGGEITPDKLIALGAVAKKYGLYTKITGGQRIDLFGAPVSKLPLIWAELIAAGFESGHAYGKAVRTVKSCVGSTWCRYGVQDAVGFAIRVEERYKGIRAPHKIKMAVSGCVRECAEAQCKDIGLIATESGWNLYVCGNGGAKPRHADLFATDLDEETALRYIDRVLMYYIHTADKLTRTATWLDGLEGGVQHLRDVVMDDALGLCEQLDADMARLVETYECEWTHVLTHPDKLARFDHVLNEREAKPRELSMVSTRGQAYPMPWTASPWNAPETDDTEERSWVDVGRVGDFPPEGGAAYRHGDAEIAVFNLPSRGAWYAVQNMCPHKREMMLSRGIVGDADGVPKVACPLHKKTFSLVDGACLSGDASRVLTFPVRVEDGRVRVLLPPTEQLESALEIHREACLGTTV